MNGIATAFQGTLGQDAELRYTGTGKAVLTFSVAVNENRPGGDGATVQWVRCTAWEELAERLADRLHRGSAVYCEGRIRLHTWQTPEGTERTGLAVSAWKVEPLGQIGKRAPKRPAEDRMSEWDAVKAA